MQLTLRVPLEHRVRLGPRVETEQPGLKVQWEQVVLLDQPENAVRPELAEVMERLALKVHEALMEKVLSGGPRSSLSRSASEVSSMSASTSWLIGSYPMTTSVQTPRSPVILVGT
jgi:hypothetical protein